MALVAEGFHQHIPKGYIYFAMGFSVFVEMLNLRARHAGKPVHSASVRMEAAAEVTEWESPPISC